MNSSDKYDQLIRDGFCVFENILDSFLLDPLRKLTDELCEQMTDEEKERFRYTGSMIDVLAHPLLAKLIAWPEALEALKSMGFENPRWSAGYIISKPPNSPPLFWHQDWWGWDDPCSYEPPPQQLFLMYYLVDTCPENGCLRAIPGSHLRRHLLHDQVPDAHTDESYRADLNSPLFATAAGETDVPVKAGDLLIGDSRLFHASHPNESAERRTVITLWYEPLFDQLPEKLQAAYVISGPEKKPEVWSEEDWALVTPLLCRYEGDAEPLPWNRTPGPELK